VRLIVVRHGHAGRKDQWHRPDRLRPLDGRGQREAQHLVRVLAPLKPLRIISSPYRRCLETMAPTADRLHLRVERSTALVPDAPERALGLMRKLSVSDDASPVLLCTHGEVLAAVLRAMAEEDGVRLPRRLPGLKGCAWVLDARRGKLRAARYVPPR